MISVKKAIRNQPYGMFCVPSRRSLAIASTRLKVAIGVCGVTLARLSPAKKGGFKKENVGREDVVSRPIKQVVIG